MAKLKITAGPVSIEVEARDTPTTPALKRFAWADDEGAQFDMNNQRKWEDLVVAVQVID